MFVALKHWVRVLLMPVLTIVLSCCDGILGILESSSKDRGSESMFRCVQQKYLDRQYVKSSNRRYVQIVSQHSVMLCSCTVLLGT